jgi:tetratricopeptide (TPR) repeat protein
MRRPIATTSAVMLLLVAFAANAQVRGTGRLQGNVTDKNTGKPVAGATISISLPSGKTMPITAKTNANGHWSALGMTSGVWNIDISAPGYVTSRGTASVSEAAANPSINIALEPQAAAQPAAAQNEVTTAPSVPKEAVDLIKEGQQLLNAKAGDVVTTSQTDTAGASTAVSHTVTKEELAQNAKRAAADLEKALPQIPDSTPELKEVRNQVMQVMAVAYYRSGDVKKSIATSEQLEIADPFKPDTAHVARELTLAQLYAENGQLDEARKTLEQLPAASVTDPAAYINIGAYLYNKNKPADAATYFTKALGVDAKNVEALYYRALSELQLKKNKDAKADLEQILALAPDSTEAKDAKQLLASLK